MRKFKPFLMLFLVVFALFLAIFDLSAQDVEWQEFPSKSMVFSSSLVNMTADKPLTVLAAPARFKVLGQEPSYITRHPLMKQESFYIVELPDGKGFIPSVSVLDTAFEAPTGTPPEGAKSLRLVAGLLLFGCGIFYYKKWKSGHLKLDSGVGLWGLAGLLALFRVFFCLTFLGQVGNFYCAPADDPGYYETAIGMLNGSTAGKWSFTIGLGLWYMPFIKYLDATTYYDIAPAFSYFSGLVIAPLTLSLTFLLFNKLAPRRIGAALLAAVALALLPFIYHWLPDKANNTISFFGMPDAGGTFFNYNSMIFSGFNTMSDTPCMFMIILTLYLAAALPRRWYAPIFIGSALGMAVLLRLNAIYFAPAAALIYLWRQKKPWSAANIAGYLAGAITAILVFAPQLYVNYQQFGDIFTFPYVLHPNLANEGFEWEFLQINIPYLVGANKAIWGMAAVSLWFISRRLQTVLVWWALPCILFFFGYTCTTYDAVRFVLPTYAALVFAAFAVELPLAELDERTKGLTYLYAGLCGIFLATTDIWYFQLSVVGLGVYLAIKNRKKRRFTAYIAALAVIMLTPGSWLIALCFAAGMVYAAITAVKFIRYPDNA